jgi:putative membrane protein
MPVSKPSLYLTAMVTLAAYVVLGYLLAGREGVTVRGDGVVALLPHAIAAVNTVALITLRLGYRAVRRGRIGRHKIFMLSSFILISLFLIMYVSRLFLGGVREYEGPEQARLFIYLPALAMHLILSIVSVPLVLYNVSTGLTTSVDKVGGTGHRGVGRWAVRLWTVSLILGVFVYLMLNWLS